MMGRIATICLLVVGLCMAQEDGSSAVVESSSSCFLCLPDTLSQELQDTAREGFLNGFGLGTAVCLACGGLVVALHLINRGAGR